MSTQKEKDKYLNDLINTQFIDLSKTDVGGISGLNLDDILKDTQKLLGENSSLIDSNQIASLSLSSLNSSEIKSLDSSQIIPTSQEEEKEEEIPDQYLHSPLDFVNYIEFQLPQEKTKIQKNSFTLKKHETTGQAKYGILEIVPQDELSAIIFEKEGETTAAICHDDYLITGNIFGQIKFFSIKDKKLVRTLPCPIKKSKKIQINAIDLSDDGDFAFAAFNNGNIAMYDLMTNKCKIVIDSVHKTSCLNVKFISRDGKVFNIFSSDADGNVSATQIKDWFIKYGVSQTFTIIEKKKYPSFIMHLLKFSEQEIKAKEYLKDIASTAIFGNLDGISIFSIEPTIDELFFFQKPPYIKENSLPDVAFGLGKAPSQISEIKENKDEDDIELQVLMAISWDKVCYLYNIPINTENKKMEGPNLLGNYINDSTIIKIGFLTKSTVYLVDKNNYFKVLNTRKFNVTEVKCTNDPTLPFITPRSQLSEIQEKIKLEGDILKQMNLRTPSNNVVETYLYTIIENKSKNDMSILTSKMLFNQQLANYQKCLKDLQKKECWKDLLTLGIEIYKGKMSALNGIPLKVEERKKIIGEYLQNLISQFLFTNTGSQQISTSNKTNFFDPSLENAKIEYNMEITIEFCIEIEAVDYLLDKILKIYESKGYRDIFLAKLEPFILCNKILKFEINEEVILNIINLYENKKKVDILSQLLLHISIKTLEIPSVKNKIESLLLITPMIYIYINGKDEDYFMPALKIYEKFEQSQELQDFFSYENIIKNKKTPLKNIRNSKQYLGHKLFWYIERSLSGKKFPQFIEDMEESSFNKAISDITYWLLNSKIISNLLNFDPKTFFEIFTKILSQEEMLEILQNNNEDDEKKTSLLSKLKEESLNEYTYDDISPLNLANYIIFNANKYRQSKPEISFYLCLFIVKISKTIELSKKNKLESLKYVFQVYSYYKPTQEEIKSLIKCSIEVLEKLEFDEEDYRTLLEYINDHIFDELKFFLLKRVKSYQQCLELLLDEQCTIPKKEEELFKFINLSLTGLKKSEKTIEIFNSFKIFVMNNLAKIGKISIKDLNVLIDKWYKKERKDVLAKLSQIPNLQFQYLELLIGKVIQNFKDNENNIIEEDKAWVDYLFTTEIKLLCELKREKEILPKLKKNPHLYPIEPCLKICKDYKVKDAIIYLYEQNQDLDSALKVCLEIIGNHYTNIINNLCSESFNVNKHDLEILAFSSSVNSTADVLERSEGAFNDKHDGWFVVLEKLYYWEEEFYKKINQVIKERKKSMEEFEEKLNNEIKELLEKMSFYVGIRKILEILWTKSTKVEFREMKPLLLKMLSSFGSQSYMLKNVESLVNGKCLEYQHALQDLNIKGSLLNFDRCQVCQKNFSENLNKKEKLLFFKCKHLQHDKCCYEENFVKNCYVCTQEEIDIIIASDERVNKFNEKAKIKIEVEKEENKIKKREDNGLNLFGLRRGFKKMGLIDNYIIDKKNMFLYDSANTCREDYRKEAKE